MKRREPHHFPSSSMSDIAFLLLLFFLILAITTRSTPVPMKAATSASPATLQENYPVLYLAKDGTLFLQDSETTIENIPSLPEVCILCDKETPFSLVAPVLEQLQKNGTTTIHALVEETDE